MLASDRNRKSTEPEGLKIWSALAGLAITVLIAVGLAVANGHFTAPDFGKQRQIATNPIGERFPTDPADMLAVRGG
jgi:hypothetical protein